jgi:transposase
LTPTCSDQLRSPSRSQEAADSVSKRSWTIRDLGRREAEWSGSQALSLVKVLTTLQDQLDEYRRQIGEVFCHHPEYPIFGSLPGAKATLGPRLLSEMGTVREEYPDADALMCQAGVSPVSYQSGQVKKCRLRRACNKVLRATVHLWANSSRMTCSWAQSYYQIKRGEGHSHASALRCLGKRWLKILWRLWQSRQPRATLGNRPNAPSARPCQGCISRRVGSGWSPHSALINPSGRKRDRPFWWRCDRGDPSP